MRGTVAVFEIWIVELIRIKPGESWYPGCFLKKPGIAGGYPAMLRTATGSQWPVCVLIFLQVQ